MSSTEFSSHLRSDDAALAEAIDDLQLDYVSGPLSRVPGVQKKGGRFELKLKKPAAGFHRKRAYEDMQYDEDERQRREALKDSFILYDSIGCRGLTFPLQVLIEGVGFEEIVEAHSRFREWRGGKIMRKAPVTITGVDRLLFRHRPPFSKRPRTDLWLSHCICGASCMQALCVPNPIVPLK